MGGQHYIIKCKRCLKVITQCRCASNTKVVSFGCCDNCRTPEVTKSEVKAITERMKFNNWYDKLYKDSKMIIIDSRYSNEWYCINIDAHEFLDDEDLAGLNSPDYAEHLSTVGKIRKHIGTGETPNDALNNLLKLIEKINN